MKVNNNPVGVFDSGIGGLTVAKAIKQVLPDERIIYLGDLLHLPYGSKSRNAVLEFTRAAVQFLIQQGIKLLVIACNTATSIALKEMKNEVDVPVIGVIEPGAYSACKASKNKRVGVIGTTRTIESNAYREAINRIDPKVSVFQRATPLLVPLIEEGWIGHPVLNVVLSEYFKFFQKTEIDTIVLGCTHYPLIRREIRDALKGIQIVDSAETTAEKVREVLHQLEGLNKNPKNERYEVYLTDCTDGFEDIGERIIGKGKLDIKLVSLNYSRGQVIYNT